MYYNNLPKTSLKVSALCLGTMMFGAQTNEADAIAIMDYCASNGVNFFDTADVYNQGESERIVGKALKGRRNDIILATKVNGQMSDNPNDRGLSRRHILSAVDESLSRLNTDYIDLYYMHAPDYGTDLEESIYTMSGLVRAGKVRYIGVSNFAAWQIADLLAICDKRGYVAPIITQNVYNALTRGVETELVPFLSAHRMGMAVYNPIAGGLLSGKHKPGQPMQNTRFAFDSNYANRYWSDENFEAVSALEKIAAENGMSILELALKWVASRKVVTSVISGVSRLEQIQQNIALLDDTNFPEDAAKACDEIWRSLAGARFAYNR